MNFTRLPRHARRQAMLPAELEVVLGNEAPAVGRGAHPLEGSLWVGGRGAIPSPQHGADHGLCLDHAGLRGQQVELERQPRAAWDPDAALEKPARHELVRGGSLLGPSKDLGDIPGTPRSVGDVPWAERPRRQHRAGHAVALGAGEARDLGQVPHTVRSPPPGGLHVAPAAAPLGAVVDAHGARRGVAPPAAARHAAV